MFLDTFNSWSRCAKLESKYYFVKVYTFKSGRGRYLTYIYFSDDPNLVLKLGLIFFGIFVSFKFPFGLQCDKMILFLVYFL